VRWNEAREELFFDRIAEALRECGILWLVFSVLDEVVQGKLTSLWLIGNAAGALAAWAAGTYIELRKK
jgi:hypothetical protein